MENVPQNTGDNAENEKLPYYTVSNVRFAVLNVITFNISGVYWIYKNWHVMKHNSGSNLSPFLRSFFAPIFIFRFCFNIKNDSLEKNISLPWNPIFLGITYILVSFLYKLPPPYWLLTSFNFVPLLYMQNSMKQWNTANGFDEVNAGDLSVSEKIVVALCYLLYFAVVIASFMPTPHTNPAHGIFGG